ncbi:hypothetical protein HCJ94_18760 [Micromonospora sp. HSS6-12]|uniref:Uncharacterized protein n=1 Tax=Micromonospora thermarum TaxID=2720024 RepID=A0ABX0Z9R1_9ACTN|nr:hypothetical protein [Micromonospora thermarum]NJP33967.1 hypothetical protein [Micromonospora thermarum]
MVTPIPGAASRVRVQPAIPRAATAVRLLLALVDGLLHNQDPAFNPTTAIATVLPAILTAQPPP